MTICCLGDLVLDVIVRLEQPLAPNADATSRIVLRPGGQAANVAAWVAALGGPARFVGKRGTDEAGTLAAAGLVELGVELAGPVEPDGNGIIVSLVDPSGERTMCSDRGVATELLPEEITSAWFDGCTHLHVSGYALLREPVRFAASAAIAVARAGGARVSIDLSSWSAIRDFGAARFRALVAELAPDVVFANEDEDDIIGGPIEGSYWIVKRGPAGASFDGEECQAPRVDNVVDTTGAGDAFAAGWLVGGRELAFEAAARCVQHAGFDARSCRLSPSRADAASSRLDGQMRDLIHVSDEVQTALEEGVAVVALETTLVAHGFPSPDGVETGLASEAAVRGAGAVPATIGVLDGQIRIGLERQELERFTPASRKLGPRDLAVCAVQGAVGATTVGGTLTAAAAIGIRFMGTGGLGGVHRGFPSPPDVSADLAAAARIPALIASSGVKSLLDVPATAELLETLGVPVIGYRTDTLPLFYDAAGGPPVSGRADDAGRDRADRRRALAPRRQRRPRRHGRRPRAST